MIGEENTNLQIQLNSKKILKIILAFLLIECILSVLKTLLVFYHTKLCCLNFFFKS